MICERMKSAVLFLLLLLISTKSFASEPNKPIGLTCEDFSWSDVETLVAPYLDDTLMTALVMQGQSSEYIVSEAASMAMSDAMPDVIKKILNSLINARCD